VPEGAVSMYFKYETTMYFYVLKIMVEGKKKEKRKKNLVATRFTRFFVTIVPSLSPSIP